MSKAVNIDDDAYEKVAKLAKKDRRPIRQELMIIIDVAYDNIGVVKMAEVNAMMPKKDVFGNIIEPEKEEHYAPESEWNELANKFAELEKEAYEITDRVYQTAADSHTCPTQKDFDEARKDVDRELKELREYGGPYFNLWYHKEYKKSMADSQQ